MNCAWNDKHNLNTNTAFITYVDEGGMMKYFCKDEELGHWLIRTGRYKEPCCPNEGCEGDLLCEKCEEILCNECNELTPTCVKCHKKYGTLECPICKGKLACVTCDYEDIAITLEYNPPD